MSVRDSTSLWRRDWKDGFPRRDPHEDDLIKLALFDSTRPEKRPQWGFAANQKRSPLWQWLRDLAERMAETGQKLSFPTVGKNVWFS
jgi:hypothetical protein